MKDTIRENICDFVIILFNQFLDISSKRENLMPSPSHFAIELLSSPSWSLIDTNPFACHPNNILPFTLNRILLSLMLSITYSIILQHSKGTYRNFGTFPSISISRRMKKCEDFGGILNPSPSLIFHIEEYSPGDWIFLCYKISFCNV